MRRGMWWAVLVVWATWMAGCVAWLGPRTLTWSEADLNQMLERRFPLDRRLLEVLDVKVSTPVVRLLPEANRLAATVSVDAIDRVFGSSYHGRLSLETALRYDAGDSSLHLVDVRVTDFNLADTGRSPRLSAQRLGALVAENLLEGVTLYRLTPEQLTRLSQRGYRPGSLQVTGRGLELTVVPASS